MYSGRDFVGLYERQDQLAFLEEINHGGTPVAGYGLECESPGSIYHFATNY